MRTAIVVGTGLVGTSIALALTARGVTVYLRDVSSSAVRVAAGLGAGRLEDPPGPVDVALVAVPPAAVGALVAELQRSGTARAYTDVASVKGPGQFAVETLADSTTFIGGHPLAGGERSGPAGARKDLCEGRPWVITPSRSTSQGVLNTVLELVSLCGAIPVVMDAQRHDEAVALVSHAPHVVASVMAAQVESAPTAATRLAGQGIRDVTRIAASNRALWGEILAGNAAAVAEVLDRFVGDLVTAVEALRALGASDDEKQAAGARSLDDVLLRGNRGHAALPLKHGAAPAELGEVSVSIADEPGELAKILSSIKEMHVNVEDIAIEHSASTAGGTVKLLIARTEVDRTARFLMGKGWQVRNSPFSATGSE
ncbi:prephenate dehydrogenase [Streptomyces parvus]|uniref:prephenate dehydrogenase n=1 Tax=Streptomyces parvus TaxID=66428 RepID=UPI0036866F5F